MTNRSLRTGFKSHPPEYDPLPEQFWNMGEFILNSSVLEGTETWNGGFKDISAMIPRETFASTESRAQSAMW